MQIIFLLIGLALIVASASVVRRISWLDSVTRKKLAANTLFAILPVLTLLVILEFSLKPYAKTFEGLTTIFVRDSELGWKLRPKSEDTWGGTPVSINGKGLRGPELDYAKQPNVKRILYLGDSVTFGFQLNSYKQTFPYLMENLLEEKSEIEVETINGGVGGYSPWQEYIFLSTEGIKYEPDLIVVAFVLNDVSEKLGLVKFGGAGEGWQLENAVSGEFEKVFEKSSIVYFARKIGARIRFGDNVQQGAQEKETAMVKDVVFSPDRSDIQEAWETTLQNVRKIFDYAKTKNIPAILVVFPFTFQFDNIHTLSSPQRILNEYASNIEVPVIDLLPILFKRMEEDGTRPSDLFLDEDHLTPVGSKIVAEILVGFVREEKLMDDGSVEGN